MGKRCTWCSRVRTVFRCGRRSWFWREPRNRLTPHPGPLPIEGTGGRDGASSLFERPRRAHAFASELTRSKCVKSKAFRLFLEPDVHAWGLPIVWFVEDVEAAIAVKIGDAGFVEADAG